MMNYFLLSLRVPYIKGLLSAIELYYSTKAAVVQYRWISQVSFIFDWSNQNCIVAGRFMFKVNQKKVFQFTKCIRI